MYANSAWKATRLFIVPLNNARTLLKLIRQTEPDAKSTLQHNYAAEYSGNMKNSRVRSHTVISSIKA